MADHKSAGAEEALLADGIEVVTDSALDVLEEHQLGQIVAGYQPDATAAFAVHIRPGVHQEWRDWFAAEVRNRIEGFIARGPYQEKHSWYQRESDGNWQTTLGRMTYDPTLDEL